MNGAQLTISLPVFISSLISFTLGSQDVSRSVTSYVCCIWSDDARTDKSIPAAIRDTSQDDWDKEAPIVAVSVDLNGDGKAEKLLPNKYLEGTGACPWIIYEPAHKKVLGELDAKVIYVQATKTNGYSVLECYCREGGGLGTVTLYEFNGQEYQRTSFARLQDEQVDNYFEKRKNVSHAR